MANKFHNQGANPNSLKGAKAPKSAPGKEQSMPMKTANWPGVPGPTQNKDRSGGTPKTGKLGSFHVKKEGI